MTDQSRDLQASSSHISLMHRPYGPRIHMDENAVGAGAIAAVTPAADTGDDLSPSEAAAAYMAAVAPKKSDPAEGAADPAADADEELPVEGDADPETDPGEIEEADADKEPSIERPKSWSKDEDAEWQSLPRATQQKIVARESERDLGTTRSQQKAADAEKAALAKAAAADQSKQTYEAKLPALMQALHNTNNTAFSDIKSQDDADLLAQVDPTRWVQWKSHQDRMAQTNFELQQAESGKAAKQQTEWQEYRNREDALATEKIPDLADPKKGPKLLERAGAKLAELGFKDEELRNFVSGKDKIAVFDHRFQQLLKDSLDLADIRAAGKRAIPIVKTVPPVQRPGIARPAGSANSDRVQALDSKLNNSGNVADAVALYLAQNGRRAAS